MDFRRTFSLFVALATVVAALLVSPGAAAREIDTVDYFCPVSFQLTLTRELPVLATEKKSVARLDVVRIGNRQLLEAAVAQYGGKLSEWRLVAYASSATFDSINDLVIVARRSSGEIYPVSTVDLSTLSYSEASSSAYDVVYSEDDELRSAFFDQKFLVRCEQPMAGGTLQANGTIEGRVAFGPVRIARQTLRLFKPGKTKLVLKGLHFANETSVAELTLTIGAAKLVPRFIASSGGNIVVHIGNETNPVSPN